MDLIRIVVITTTLVLLDLLWFQVSVKTVYSPVFDTINKDGSYLNLTAAIMAWLLLAILISNYAYSPASAVGLGLLVYGVYNFVNLATLQNWTLHITAADTLWGGVVCFFGYLVGEAVAYYYT